MSKLDSLVVDLQVNTAQLKQGLDKANDHLDEFGKQVKELGDKVREFGQAMVLEIGKEAAEALGEFVLKGAEVTDQMGKIARSAQVPVETFSRLSYAAKLGGVSTEDFGGAFNKLNKALGEASTGSAKQAALFQALGVKLTDSAGHARDSGEIFKELATKLGEMAPGYAKATVEQELFGKSGTALDTALRNIAEGMADVGGEADKLGQVIDERAAAAAERFVEDMDRLKLASDGIARQVAAQLTPILARFTDQLLNSKEGAQFLHEAVIGLTGAMKVLMSVGVGIVAAFDYVGTALAGGAASAVAALAGDFKGANDIVRQMQEELSSTTKAAADRLNVIWGDASNDFDANLQKQDAAAKRSGENVLALQAAQEKAAEASKEAMKELTKVAEDYEAKVSGFGAGPLEALQAKLEHGALAEKLKAIGSAADDMKARIMAAAAALHELEMGKLSLKLDFDISQKARATGRDVGQRQLAFDQVGATSREAAQMSTAGFASFDAALSALASSTDKYDRKLAEAELLKLDGDEEGAQRALAMASIQQTAADNAKKAADGFQEIAKIDFEDSKARIEGILSSVAGAAQGVLSAMGDFGKVVDDAIKGFQQGGWVGAIVAVIADVLARFKRFSEITDISNKALYDLIEAMKPGLNALVNGLGTFMQAIDKLVKMLGTTLNPVLTELGRIFGHIGNTLSYALDAIRPIVDMLANLSSAFQSLLDVLDPMQYIIKLLGALLKIVGIGMLEVSNGIQTALAWVFGQIGDFVKEVIPNSGDTVAWLYGIRDKMNKGAKDAQDQVQTMWDGVTDTFDHFFDSTDNKDTQVNTDVPDASGKIVDLGDAAGQAATAMDKMTEQLTNVPQGFRIAAATYAATAVKSAFTEQASSQPPNVVVHVAGTVTSEQNLVTSIAKKMRLANFYRTGTKIPR